MTGQQLGERDILRFRMISDPQLSPAGSRLASLSTREREWFDRSLRAEVSS